jgi:hypothetical protein
MWDSRKFLPKAIPCRDIPYRSRHRIRSYSAERSIQQISIGEPIGVAHFADPGDGGRSHATLSRHHLIDDSRVRRPPKLALETGAVARARHNNKMLRLSALATDWAV